MSVLLQSVHQGAFVAGAAALIYVLLVSATALSALLARTPVRRRDAREVLKILLRGCGIGGHASAGKEPPTR